MYKYLKKLLSENYVIKNCQKIHKLRITGVTFWGYVCNVNVLSLFKAEIYDRTANNPDSYRKFPT